MAIHFFILPEAGGCLDTRFACNGGFICGLKKTIHVIANAFEFLGFPLNMSRKRGFLSSIQIAFVLDMTIHSE